MPLAAPVSLKHPVLIKGPSKVVFASIVLRGKGCLEDR